MHTWTYSPQKHQSGSAFALRYILLLRSCKSMDVFVIPSLPSLLSENRQQQGAFAPRELPRLNTTTRPSATLSPSAHFPVLPVIEPTLLRRFRTGARRASPVAQSVLCHRATASTPPKWVGRLSQLSTAHAAFAHWWQARPFGIDCRGHLCVHSRCGPMTRKSPQGRPCR